jgi:ectoine hydroxylase-related dioxygenase (phytanoyl-CoA dioxygenase family)
LFSAAESQQAISFIRAHGYGLVSKVFAPSDLFAVSAELSKQNLKRSRAGARHVLSLRSVTELAQSPSLMEIARGLLGNFAIPFRATFFDKSPNSNWLVAWHQDTALPLVARNEIPGWGPWSTKDGVLYAHAPAEGLEHVLALRVHLNDSTNENGPLRVIPDTHKIGVLTDQEIQQRVGNSSGVECLIEAGGVVAMHPLLLHASSKSDSELPRRVLHMEYASSLVFENSLELAVV